MKMVRGKIELKGGTELIGHLFFGPRGGLKKFESAMEIQTFNGRIYCGDIIKPSEIDSYCYCVAENEEGEE